MASRAHRQRLSALKKLMRCLRCDIFFNTTPEVRLCSKCSYNVKMMVDGCLSSYGHSGSRVSKKEGFA
jgi:hypothetical protein